MLIVADTRLEPNHLLKDKGNISLVHPDGSHTALPISERAEIVRGAMNEKEGIPKFESLREYVMYTKEKVAHAVAKVLSDECGLKKFDATILVNSLGGTHWINMLFQGIGTFAKNNGGTVRAYGTSTAVSAGYLSLCAAEEWHLLEDTIVSHHRPRMTKEDIEATLQRLGEAEALKFFARNRQYAEASYDAEGEILLKRCKEQYRNGIQCTLEMGKAEQGWATFTGKELHKTGVANQVYMSTSELKTSFKERIGYDVPHHAVAQFFELSEHEEYVRQAYGLTGANIRFDLRKDGQAAVVRALCLPQDNELTKKASIEIRQRIGSLRRGKPLPC